MPKKKEEKKPFEPSIKKGDSLICISGPTLALGSEPVKYGVYRAKEDSTAHGRTANIPRESVLLDTGYVDNEVSANLLFIIPEGVADAIASLHNDLEWETKKATRNEKRFNKANNALSRLVDAQEAFGSLEYVKTYRMAIDAARDLKEGVD